MAVILTDKGFEILSNRVKGNLTEPLKIGWGTGTIAPTSSDTTLQTEDVTGGYVRATGVSSIVTVVIANDTYQVSGSLVALAALTITEWGLFDTAGNLLLREVQNPGQSLSIGGIINFVLKIQISRCLNG